MKRNVTPALDVRAADWVIASLTTFGESVLSVVPAGFEVYLRVFHPAHRYPDGGSAVPVSWHEIAAANGTHAQPGMQLSAITRSYRHELNGQDGVFDQPPADGRLPGALAALLAGVLGRHTATPDYCWFAVWDGYGYTPAEIAAAPTFDLPGRTYFLHRGPVSAAAESLADPPLDTVRQPLVAKRPELARRHRDRLQDNLHRVRL